MARGPFPTGEETPRNLSDQIYQANHTADVPAWAAGGVADAAQSFGRQLHDMAEKAWTREGQAAAAHDVGGADPLALRPGRGVDDAAYNAVVREQMLANRQAAYLDGLDKIETDNPDNLGTFAAAVAAHRQAFADNPTNDPELDARMASFVTLQDGAAQRRVRTGEERRRVEVARGAFVAAATTGRTALGQAIAAAGFDDQGAALVGAGLNQYAGTLARFGPREAFNVGGVEFAADPTRSGAMTPAELGTAFATAQAETRMSWIASAGEAAPDLASKRAFAGQVRERWTAGDPAFAGLDAGDMDRLTARLDADGDRAATDMAAHVRAAGESARDMLKAVEYGGDVDTGALRSAAQASGDPGLIAEVDYRLNYGFAANPTTGAGAGGGVPGVGFQGAADVLLDRLEGPQLVANDGGRGRSQFGVTELSHPEAWRDGRVDRAEAVRVARTYWDAIGGDQLEPDLATAALATAFNAGEGVAKDFLARSHGDVDQFMALETERYRRLAGNDQGKLDGWLARQGKVRGAIASARAQRRAQDGYTGDPIGYARGTRTRPAMATVAEFNPGDVFAGGDATRAWGAAIRSRRATGQALSHRDGVPSRILDDGEAAFYKSEIERDPAKLVLLAASAAQALGGDGARDLFGELGRAGMAGADLQLAQLALTPTNANIVRSALDGRALRADGAKPVAWGEDDSIDDVMRDSASAWSSTPELGPALRGVAEDMAIADAARGQLKPAGAYVNSALGATVRDGARYGGVVRVNGGVTVAPAWVRADRMDDVLEVAAENWTAHDRGPVFANGAEIPARVLANRYRLTATASGRYRLINPQTGQPAPARDGSAFEFDIELPAFREYLAHRLPDAVLGAR